MIYIYRVLTITVIFAHSLIVFEADAQSSLGLSINYGDNLTFTPNYSDLLLNRKSFTPTLVYSNQKGLPLGLSTIFGAQAGIAGYQLIPEVSDPLSRSRERYPFIDYGIFVSRIEVIPGKTFFIGKREMFIGLGGGVSYYLLFPFTTMSVFGSSGDLLFSSYIEAPNSGTIAWFAKVNTKISLSQRFDLALQYTRHWESILHGEFEFYNDNNPPETGSIKLIPQGVSLILLYRLKK